jgi:hypothetical protein
MGGGWSARCGVEEGKRERERASGAAAHSVDVGLGWLRAAWSKAAARTRGGGGLVNKGGRAGRRRCGAADRWGRKATGKGGQWRGAGRREKSEVARQGTDRRARATHCRGAVQTRF